MTTVRDALAGGASLLTESETPFLDASILLASVLHCSKEKLYASYPDPVTDEQHSRYTELLRRRRDSTPVAYLLEEKEFYGRSFHVDNRVLIPRPDTETLIETVLPLIRRFEKPPRVLDLCCGSGCIGITIKSCEPNCAVTCTDLSRDALDVCTYNSKRILGELLPALESNLFENIRGTFDIIVSNPPYVTEREVQEMGGGNWPEPAIALEGGSDGLLYLRKIITEAGAYLAPGGYLLLESAMDQTYYVERKLAASGFCETAVVQDLEGRNRVTLGRKQK